MIDANRLLEKMELIALKMREYAFLATSDIEETERDNLIRKTEKLRQDFNLLSSWLGRLEIGQSGFSADCLDRFDNDSYLPEQRIN